MVQQKPLLRLIGLGIEVPGTGGLANRIPGPDGARFDRLTEAAHATHLAMHRFHPDPVTILKTIGHTNTGVEIEVVVGVNLSQPRILRIPRMVHRHGALGDRTQRELVTVGTGRLQRFVVERQWVKVLLHPLAQSLRRLLAGALALRRETELLQHLGVDMDIDRLHVSGQPMMP